MPVFPMNIGDSAWIRSEIFNLIPYNHWGLVIDCFKEPIFLMVVKPRAGKVFCRCEGISK